MSKVWDFDKQTWKDDGEQTVIDKQAIRDIVANAKTLDELAAEWEAEGFIVLPKEKKKFTGSADKAAVADVESALSFISADVDNSTWVMIGFAIKDEYGDAGFEIWNSWSSKGEKYKPREMKTRWASFGRRDGVTIGSLFYLAEQAGWSRTLVEPEKTPDFIINGKKTGVYKETVKIADIPLPPKIEPLSFPPNLLEAPGLPGKLAAFINRTSLMPQPILALGAAIATAGALMGRKVRGDTNLRTNFYVIGLAPSGAGKDHARTLIKRLLFDTGIGNIELGVPASSAGLISGLRDRGEGRGLILWDEFGRILKQLTGYKAGTYERDIVTALVELFSSAQSVYLGKSYANHDGKNPLKPIDQPCLSVYATSVPTHFYDAMSNTEAVDGFLSRWLIFESRDYSLEEEEREETFKEAPQEMIDLCKYWKEQPFNTEENGGNLSSVTRCVPRLIKCSEQAATHLKSFSSEMRKLAMTNELAGDPTGPIWSRAAEHARRLALVAHEGDQIELSVAEWATSASHYFSKYMAHAISDYVSSSELEAQTKSVLRAIRDRSHQSDPWMTRADISRLFQGIQARIRNEILTSLLERGEIVEERMPAIGKGRPSLKYRAS